MKSWVFDNRFANELPGEAPLPHPGSAAQPARRQVLGASWSAVLPTKVAAPRLIAHSDEVAQQLGLSAADLASPTFANVFGGNELLPGMRPIATCYGGHQFGHWAGQLGDGRAISLGELVTPSGARAELQLKGAGPTPYSRTADGRAVLRSSVREFLCSEAMHALGVPTTRALSLVATGEPVMRDMLYDGHPAYEPGAIVCRVAPSFTRFGHFELPAARRDLPLLKRLLEFTIARDFPELRADADPATRHARFFMHVCERTARMVAHFMRVGFVHGVMNTDNMSILGLTIDYGPYGFVDNFDLDWTPNTTDAEHRRYRFGQQAQVAHWNLSCLARALAPVFESVEPLQQGIDAFPALYEREMRAMTAAKLGFATLEHDDEPLVDDLYTLLQNAEVDMTLFFRQLERVELSAGSAPTLAPFDDAFYDQALRTEHSPLLSAWLERYAVRARRDDQAPEQRRARMNAANPRFILRNYLAQEAIDAATQGDESLITTLLAVMRRPYDEQPEHARFAKKRPDWARRKVGCSMLSCSS